MWPATRQVRILLSVKLESTVFKMIFYRNWDKLRQTLVEMINAIVDEFLEPQHNELIPRD